jgi:hypothetical protein
MSREYEFLARHREDLKRGAELCRFLQSQAKAATPRELKYLELRKVCERLEGSARQMAHERGDDFRWLSLANHYVNVGKMVQKLRRSGHWLPFGKLAEVFEAGESRLDRLASMANGITSLNPSGLLILPPHMRVDPAPKPGLILP